MDKFCKNIFLLLTLFLLAIGPLRAQNRKIDSLKAALTVFKEDTSRVMVLNELSRQLIKAGKTDTAIRVALSAGHLALKLHFEKALAFSYTLTGLAYSEQGNYPAALSSYFTALKLYTQISDLKEMGNLTDKVASIYNNQGNYRESVKYNLISLRISVLLTDKEGIAGSYNNLGVAYQSLGNYPEALRYLFAALKIKEALGNKSDIAISITNIGNVYYGQGSFKEALEKYKEALEICRQINETYGIALCYNNIGATYTELEKYEEALKNHFESLKIKMELDDETGIAYSYINLGLANANLKKNQEALKYYSDALKILERLGDKEGIALLCNNIGLLYIEQGKVSESRNYLNRGLKLAEETGSLTDSKASYEHLSSLDSIMGDHRSALANYKMFIALKDSLNNEENTKKTVQAQMQYEFDKKESEAKFVQEKKDEVARAEIKKQRILLLAISGFGILILVFALFAYRSFLQKKKANNEISLQKELIEEKQKEILDSIYYARRIQRCLIPTEKQVYNLLKKTSGTI